MQHRAIIMDINVTLRADYFSKKADASFPYDLYKARLNPKHAKRDIEQINTSNMDNANKWSDIHSKIIMILSKKYPKIKNKQITNPYLMDLRIIKTLNTRSLA